MTAPICLTPERLAELRAIYCEPLVIARKPRTPRPYAEPRAPRAPYGSKRLAAQALLGGEADDLDIATAAGMSRSWVGKVRRMAGVKTERWLVRDTIIAWVLAWPEVGSAELVAASGVAARARWDGIRRELGIPSAKALRDDARRAAIVEMREGGASYRVIGERMGIHKHTVGGILRRHRNGSDYKERP